MTHTLIIAIAALLWLALGTMSMLFVASTDPPLSAANVAAAYAIGPLVILANLLARASASHSSRP